MDGILEMSKSKVLLVCLCLVAITLAQFGAGNRGVLAQFDAQQDQADLLLPLMLNQFIFGPGAVTGRVIDASNGTGLFGAMVCLPTMECSSTNTQGYYTISANPGEQQLSASNAGYFSIIKTVEVIGGHTVELNFALSPYLTGGNVELRIVLTWDPSPTWPPDQVENDLDAHLWLEALLPAHVYFEEKGDCTTYPNACLEADYRRGFGPETIAIRQLEPETIYHYGVLNYNQGANGVPLINFTAAHLEVYDEDGLLTSFDVPQTPLGGNFWYAFTYSYSPQYGNWIVTPVNCIANYQEDIADIVSQCP